MRNNVVKTIDDLEKWVDRKIDILRETEEMGLLTEDGAEVLKAFKQIDWHIQFSHTFTDLKELLEDINFFSDNAEKKALASFIRFMEKQ